MTENSFFTSLGTTSILFMLAYPSAENKTQFAIYDTL